MRKRLRGQATPSLEVERALVERSEDLRVALRPHDDDDRLMVLRRGSDHRGPTDVDLLDCVLEPDVRPQHGVDERVEVAAHEVDLAKAALGQRLDVLGRVAPGQDAGVHAGMERLDAAVQDLWESGQVADRPHVDHGVLKCLQRAPGRKQVIAEPLEATREGRETRFVANRQQSCWQHAPSST